MGDCRSKRTPGSDSSIDPVKLSNERGGSARRCQWKLGKPCSWKLPYQITSRDWCRTGPCMRVPPVLRSTPCSRGLTNLSVLPCVRPTVSKQSTWAIVYRFRGSETWTQHRCRQCCSSVRPALAPRHLNAEQRKESAIGRLSAFRCAYFVERRTTVLFYFLCSIFMKQVSVFSTGTSQR